jgi:hypothetical protein
VEGAALAASTALPPTPNDAACACLSSKLGCSFKMPGDGDYTKVVGTLTGVVCGLLPGVGGNCNDISANGTTGVYGEVAMCDPSACFFRFFFLTLLLFGRGSTRSGRARPGRRG